jgi:glycosyltransferase involved in cell wall biosynthesis
MDPFIVHVLIIPSWYPDKPGDIAGSFFREQALALQRSGCVVGVIYPQLKSLRNWRPAASAACRTLEFDGAIPTLRSRGVNWFPLLHGAASRLWSRHGLELYKNYVSQFGKPDIIHAHSALYAGELARLLWQRESVPFVITEHSSSFSRGRVSKTQARIAKHVFSEAHRKFAVSERFASFLDNHFDEEPSNWEVMPNIVDGIFHHVIVEKSRIDRHFVFVCIAMLVEGKGVHHLITAFAKAFASDPQVVLKIGGDGPERSRLEHLARTLGVYNRVDFLGSLTRAGVVREISSADVLVHPSSYETFGVVLIEALALGKPVVATRCGGPDSIVRDRDGMLIPVNDDASLAMSMSAIRDRISEYDPEEIRQSCMARFGEHAVVERLKKVYVEVLDKLSADGVNQVPGLIN